MPTTKSATAPTVTTIADPTAFETCDSDCPAFATVQVVFPRESGNEHVLTFCASHATRFGFTDHATAHNVYATSANVYV